MKMSKEEFMSKVKHDMYVKKLAKYRQARLNSGWTIGHEATYFAGIKRNDKKKNGYNE